MADLIDRQAAIDIVEFECGEWRGLAGTIVKAIEQLPSAQPEIIWCRDCKHYSPFTDEYVSWCPIIGHKGLPEDAYCFRAERKDNG